jgi:hypothetical protein
VTNEYASLNPDNMVEGASLPSGNLEVMESRFTVFDYQGKATRPALTLRWKLRNLETAEMSDQHYSAGDPTKLQPSADGKQVVLTGGTEGKSIAVPSVILKLPWEKTAADVVGAKAADGDGDLDGEIVKFVQVQLAANGGSVTKQALGAAAFSTLADHPRKNDIISAVFTDAFDVLMASNGVKVEGDTVTA